MANLEGIRVTAFLVDSAGTYNRVGSSTTDENGDFSINGLQGGTYKLKYEDPSGSWMTEYYSNAESLDLATGFSVIASETKAGIHATLSAASHITGTVTGA